jgi:hypothetical protein
MRVRRPGPLDDRAVWLGDQDSNLGEVIQSHLCYRYIIPHCAALPIIAAERGTHNPVPAKRDGRRRRYVPVHTLCHKSKLAPATNKASNQRKAATGTRPACRAPHAEP